MIFIKSKPIKVLLLSVCLNGLLFSNFVWSSQNTKPQKYLCNIISKSQAINNAKRRTKGKIVSAKLVNKGKRSIYKVRILIDKKRVKTITIPACQ